MEHRREEPASGWREIWCTGEVWSLASGWAGLDSSAFNQKLWAGLRFFFLHRQLGERWSIGERNQCWAREREMVH
jgi:hypothetical protein